MRPAAGRTGGLGRLRTLNTPRYHLHEFVVTALKRASPGGINLLLECRGEAVEDAAVLDQDEMLKTVRHGPSVWRGLKLKLLPRKSTNGAKQFIAALHQGTYHTFALS